MILKQKKAEQKFCREAKYHLKSGSRSLNPAPNGRFQAVAMGPSSCNHPGHKEGRLWIAGGDSKGQVSKFCHGQVQPYSITGKRHG